MLVSKSAHAPTRLQQGSLAFVTKDLTALTLDDLLDVPVWRRSMRAKFVDPNEGIVAPMAGRVTAESFVVVRCRFTLADGTLMLGHCQPSPSELPAYPPAYLRPCVVTAEGRVPFWLGGRVSVDGRGRKRGEEPTQAEVARYYDILGRARSAVFPLSFSADVELPEGFIADGEVPGFGYMRGTKFAWVE